MAPDFQAVCDGTCSAAAQPPIAGIPVSQSVGSSRHDLPQYGTDTQQRPFGGEHLGTGDGLDLRGADAPPPDRATDGEALVFYVAPIRMGRD